MSEIEDRIAAIVLDLRHPGHALLMFGRQHACGAPLAQAAGASLLRSIARRDGVAAATRR